jgi:hypothetical protein
MNVIAGGAAAGGGGAFERVVAAQVGHSSQPSPIPPAPPDLQRCTKVANTYTATTREPLSRRRQDACCHTGNTKVPDVLAGFGSGRQRMGPWTRANSPHFRGVRVHASTGSQRVEGNRRASRVSDLPHPKSLTLGFATFCIAGSQADALLAKFTAAAAAGDDAAGKTGFTLPLQGGDEAARRTEAWNQVASPSAGHGELPLEAARAAAEHVAWADQNNEGEGMPPLPPGEFRWVTRRARWVTLRARWVTR